MGSEYMGPLPDPQEQQSIPERKPSPSQNTIHTPLSTQQQKSMEQSNNQSVTPPSSSADEVTIKRGDTDFQFEEPSYREHVTGALPVPPSEAPNFYGTYWPGAPVSRLTPPVAKPTVPQVPQQPLPAPAVPQQGYPPYNYGPQIPYPGQNGHRPPYPQPYPFPPGYYGYAPYPYYPQWQQPAKPKRDGYLLGMAITSFIGSILVLIAGMGTTLLLLLLLVVPDIGTIRPDQRFAAIIQFTAFSLAGLIGGSFGLYHSIRSLFLKKPSAELKLPWFWAFLIFYIIVLVIGAIIASAGLAVAYTPLTILLIALAAIFPALAILSLGVRIIHYPRGSHWPTTWRRFTMALLSGGTLAIVAALIFELILTVLATRSLGVTGFSIDNPDQPIPQDPRAIVLLFVIVSVIAPLVEEAVKPLAVTIMIGRMRSAAEAFVLGLSCGIGFNLIETSGYIGMGYRDWLTVAVERSSAGLLHGFGAGMVSLGWYFLSHRKEAKRPILLAFGCWIYAVLQHAIWNGGAVGLQLLPAPLGPYFEKGTIPLGLIQVPSIMLVYSIETLLMLTFFIFVARKLRGMTTKEPPQPVENQPQAQPMPQTQVSVRV